MLPYHDKPILILIDIPVEWSDFQPCDASCGNNPISGESLMLTDILSGVCSLAAKNRVEALESEPKNFEGKKFIG